MGPRRFNIRESGQQSMTLASVGQDERASTTSYLSAFERPVDDLDQDLRGVSPRKRQQLPSAADCPVLLEDLQTESPNVSTIYGTSSTSPPSSNSSRQLQIINNSANWRNTVMNTQDALPCSQFQIPLANTSTIWPDLRAYHVAQTMAPNFQCGKGNLTPYRLRNALTY